jgi:hypothetical protein
MGGQIEKEMLRKGIREIVKGAEGRVSQSLLDCIKMQADA